ncbi:serine-rich adhesin for platelets-like [Penaeus japonicus]|uniref:serine-rich adhesin for platelets-like n=1 Tax=Penaeus japonicus TaxID=27405 RepID=UPI001C70C75C|nr:serine-rich adhesin for platelets-like [Penaeus japonicus]
MEPRHCNLQGWNAPGMNGLNKFFISSPTKNRKQSLKAMSNRNLIQTFEFILSKYAKMPSSNNGPRRIRDGLLAFVRAPTGAQTRGMARHCTSQTTSSCVTSIYRGLTITSTEQHTVTRTTVPEFKNTSRKESLEGRPSTSRLSTIFRGFSIKQNADLSAVSAMCPGATASSDDGRWQQCVPVGYWSGEHMWRRRPTGSGPSAEYQGRAQRRQSPGWLGSYACRLPPGNWIAYRKSDRHDGADEVGCDRSPCNGFRCWNDVCIPGTWHCDGHEDCRDGEDEYECPVCSQEALKCPSGGGCVSVNLTCDGVEDCPDGWDESGEVCKRNQCGPDEVPCWTGQCVEHRKLCDGVSDCPASEDEDSHFCLAFRSMRVVTTPLTSGQAPTTQCTPAEVREINCTQEEFRCASGECVLRTTLCDGKPDCWTADDEEFPICNLIFNVDVAKQGVEDKRDGSECDEATMTYCPSGRCVPHGETCNIENDCEENDTDRGVTCVNTHRAVTTVSSTHEKTVTNDIDNEIENDLTIDVPPTTGVISQGSRDQIHGHDDAEDANEAAEVPAKNITSLTSNNAKSGAAENEIEEEIKENDLNLASLEDDDVFEGIDVSVDVLVEGSTYPGGSDADFDVTTSGDFDDADLESSGDDEIPRDVTVTVSPPSVTPTVLEVTTTTTLPSVSKEDEMRIHELAYNNSDMNSIFDYSEEDEDSQKSLSYSSSMESDESSETAKATFDIGGIGSNMSIENSSFITSKSSLSSLESEESEYDGELLNQTTKSLSTLEGSASTTPSAEASAVDSNITVIEYDISSDKKSSPISNASLNMNDSDDKSTHNVTVTEVSETAKATAGSVSPSNATSEEEDLGSGEGESYEEFEAANNTSLTGPSPSDTSETRHSESTIGPVLHTFAINEQEESTSNVTTSPSSSAKNTEDDLTAEIHTSSSTTEVSSRSTVEVSTPSSTVESSTSSSTPEATTTSSTDITFATEITNWKDQQIDQQNLTVLIAIHSEMNQSQIPQYVIHGLDGNTYEYEVVTVVKDEELAKKVQLTATRKPPEDKSVIHTSSKKEPRLTEEDSSSEDHETETKVNNGTHEISYLQHNDISSASSVSLSLASLTTVVLLRALLPAG